MTSTTELAELTDLEHRISDLRRFEQDYRERLRLFHQQQLNDLDPASGILTIPRLPADQRRKLIEWLAEQFIADQAKDWPAGTATHLLAVWGNGSLRGIALDRAFADYLEAERMRRAFEAGLVTAKEIIADLRCLDPQHEARKATREMAAQALAVLVHGDPSMATAGRAGSWERYPD